MVSLVTGNNIDAHVLLRLQKLSTFSAGLDDSLQLPFIIRNPVPPL